MAVRKAFLTALLALGFLGLYALTAHADIVPVAPADWTGSRVVPAASGVVATDGWLAIIHGFEIDWAIVPVVGGYQYTYSFVDPGTAPPLPVEPQVYDFILEVVPGVNTGNVAGYISSVVGWDPVNAVWNAVSYSGPQSWTSATEPNLPSPLYGIKFDLQTANAYILRFVWTKPPIWGDFYAKDGSEYTILATAYNTGEGVEGETSPYTDWIPTPGIPEPSSLLLLVLGSSAVLGSKLRSRKK